MGEAAIEQRSPAEIRRDIDATRSELSTTIDQIEDRVSPSRIVDRSTQRFRSRWERTREVVMGSADEGKQRLSAGSDAAGQHVDEAQDSLERSVRGNPLAAGLIAFGVGALASSLLPSSRTEQRLAATVREAAEPVVRSELQHGKEAGQHMADEAKHAVEETAQTARDAAQSTMDSAKGAAQSTGEHAKEAAQSTGEHAKDAAQQTKDQAKDEAKDATEDSSDREQGSPAATWPPTDPPTYGSTL